MLEQSEAKVTKLKEELVNAKEALNKASLEYEVLSHKNAELGMAMFVILTVTYRYLHKNYLFSLPECVSNKFTRILCRSFKERCIN